MSAELGAVPLLICCREGRNPCRVPLSRSDTHSPSLTKHRRTRAKASDTYTLRCNVASLPVPNSLTMQIPDTSNHAQDPSSSHMRPAGRSRPNGKACKTQDLTAVRQNLLLGIWPGKLGQATEGSKSSQEWLCDQRHVGEAERDFCYSMLQNATKLKQDISFIPPGNRERKRDRAPLLVPCSYST